MASSSGVLRRSKADVAREAFAHNNREGSRLAHSSSSVLAAPAICERGHKSHAFPTDLRKGVEVAAKAGNQGVLFCCVLATGLESLNLHTEPAFSFFLCLASLLGFAFALGFLDYANKQADKTFGENERAREKWECENFLEGEQKEMVELYVTKGMNKEDAEKAIALLSQNQELFIDIMMAEELGILPYSGLQPHLSGLVTMLGFFLFGAIPLLAYLPFVSSLGILSLFHGKHLGVLLALSTLILVGVSALKTFYCISLEAWWRQGLLMTSLQVVIVLAVSGLCSFLRTSIPHAAHPLFSVGS